MCRVLAGGASAALVAALAALFAMRYDSRLYQGHMIHVPSTLEGRTVLVTGSSKGIGLEAAKRFHAHGASVIVSGSRRCEDAAADVRTAGRGLGTVSCLPCNLEDFTAVRRFAAEVLAASKTLDYVVFNAGMVYMDWRPNASFFTGPSGHDRLYAANYLSSVLLAGLLAPHLAAGGAVVLIGSIHMWHADHRGLMPESGRVPWETMPWQWLFESYCSSKLALWYLRCSLERRLAPRNVSVVGSCPGFFTTDMTRHIARPDAWVYHWTAPPERGGQHIFESAFAELPGEFDTLYGSFFPASLYRFIAARGWAEWRRDKPSLFYSPQNFQKLTLGLHASVGPECDAGTEEALWKWSAEAVGMPAWERVEDLVR